MNKEIVTYDASVKKAGDPMPIKTLEVLEVLATANGGLGVTEISRALDINKSTIHRILAALVDRQYVLKDEQTRRYRLGFKLLLLSSHVLDSLELRQIARPELIELANKTRETIHLVWKEGNEGVYIEKIDTPETIGLLSRVGKRVPLYSSAAGKTMLAFMDDEKLASYLAGEKLSSRTPNTITDPLLLKEHFVQVRKQGFALDIEENRLGIICVAAPIFQSNGQVIAGVSISAPSFRFSVDKAKELGPVVHEAALCISKKLGFIQQF
ncbi:MAG: IclR family transcriptional regulator [Dehalobacterium sp.]